MARSGPPASTSSSRWAPVWRIRSDGPRNDQGVTEAAAGRGDRDQDADLARDGVGFPAHEYRRRDPPRHRHKLRGDLQWRGNLRRAAISRHRGQSLYHVLYDRPGERRARVSLDRRQRLRRQRTGEDHRRMTQVASLLCALARIVAAAAGIATPSLAGDIPASERRSGYESMSAATQA